jgi:hypothetical protein
MSSLATVYLRKKLFLIHSSSKTTGGVWISFREPYLSIPDNSDDLALVTGIRNALAGSRVGVPNPQTWKEWGSTIQARWCSVMARVCWSVNLHHSRTARR